MSGVNKLVLFVIFPLAAISVSLIKFFQGDVDKAIMVLLISILVLVAVFAFVIIDLAG